MTMIFFLSRLAWVRVRVSERVCRGVCGWVDGWSSLTRMGEGDVRVLAMVAGVEEVCASACRKWGVSRGLVARRPKGHLKTQRK